MVIDKIKIVGDILEVPAKKHCQFSQCNLFTAKMGKSGQMG
jgi:hypothetical protein